MSLNDSIVIAFNCPYDFYKKRFHRNVPNFNKVLFKFIGPFAHTALLCGNKRKIREGMKDQYYSISIALKTNGVKDVYRPFDHDAYSFWRIKATKKQQNKIVKLAKHIKANDVYLSRWKLFGFNKLTSDLYYPTEKNQKGWICSELTMFLLQESGVIPKDQNPKSYTPTGMYEYFKINKIGEPINLYTQVYNSDETYKIYKEIV